MTHNVVRYAHTRSTVRVTSAGRDPSEVWREVAVGRMGSVVYGHPMEVDRPLSGCSAAV